MAIVSVQARRRSWELGATAFTIGFVWLIQLTLVSLVSLTEAVASLPLTFTIVWAAVFGSPMGRLKPSELRLSTVGQMIMIQALGGSVSGALVGAAFGALYASVLPVYPLYLPIIGWISGYFCLRGFNQGVLFCIPLVLMSTVFSESLMAVQLQLMGRSEVFERLTTFALPEAILNSLVAPFIYIPMRAWYDFSHMHAGQAEK